MSALAKQYGVHMVLGTQPERHGHSVFISCAVLDDQGRLLGVVRKQKVHDAVRRTGVSQGPALRACVNESLTCRSHCQANPRGCPDTLWPRGCFDLLRRGATGAGEALPQVWHCPAARY